MFNKGLLKLKGDLAHNMVISRHMLRLLGNMQKILEFKCQ